MTKSVLALVVAGLALTASEARADIVVFKNGRTMSVKACRIDETSATMLLREGGEITFPSAVIARIDPDEVPYPEDTPVPPVEPVAAAVPDLAVAAALVPAEVLASKPFADLISTSAAAHNVDVRRTAPGSI